MSQVPKRWSRRRTPEGCGLGWGGEGDLLHLAGEFGGGALVGVEEEDPRVFEGDGSEGGVAVGGVVVEGAGVDVRAGGFCDLDGGVGALGVEDVDVVGPGDAGETAGEIALLVASEDEDGDHLLAMVSRRRVRRWRIDDEYPWRCVVPPNLPAKGGMVA